ncbi:MAG: T9SS C-terminal target domain-containing protein, partial [Bacteroidetes bacterium]
DVCECGSNATNNCTPPAISASPVAGVGCTCATGYVCQNNVETGFTDRCVPAGYVYSRGLDATYNTLDDTYMPIVTGGVCPRPYSLDLGTDNALGGTGTAADKCVCAQNTIRPNHPNNFTIEYDTRNGVSDVAANAGLVVYQTTDCGDENAFTQLACKDVVPAGTEGIETHNIGGLPMTHGSGNETYYVRILNKTAGKTLIGSMCVYYGTDISNETCSFPLNDYGALEGEFKNFTIGHDGSNPPTGESLPSTTIPNCVSPGGSNPSSNGSFPIRSDAWMQFTVPVGANYSSVTVQFDNAGFLPARNAAIAIYTSPEIPTGTSWVRDNGQTNLTLNCNAYGASNPVSTANPNRGGLFLLDCQNSVFIGAETATINTTYSNGAEPSSLPITKARTYYVRVMNVHNENIPSTLVGRLRVFPAATCNLGSEMVYDGDFQNWPGVRYMEPNATNWDYTNMRPNAAAFNPANPTTTAPNNMNVVNTTSDNATLNANANSVRNYNIARSLGIMRIPDIGTNDAYPNDIDGVFGDATRPSGVAAFATDYGYVREGGGIGANNAYNTAQEGSFWGFRNHGGRGEFGPEGLYAVRHSPWTLKEDWFCFGKGYSGYGGRTGGGEPQASYCLTGAGLNNEPCGVVTLESGSTVGTSSGGTSVGIVTVGQFNTTTTTDDVAANNTGPRPFDYTENGMPATYPSASEANFMILNGSYNPASNLPPGKMWCQTVPRASTDVNDVSYYMFSIWVQNMISAGRNLDVPQLRLTVCDMEDPNNPGSLPTERDIYTTANGDTGADNQRLTRLPGLTDVNLTSWFPEENVNQRVRHLPRPGNNRRFALVSEGLRPPSYGAAMSCNLSQNNGWSGSENVAENLNARLKVLGASFLIPERPDNWVLVRCVYRAPRFVREMNLCVENLSLTKNGNDIGIDGISFRKCDAADAETFDRLLKGDPCALSTDGKETGIPLMASTIDFTANLLGDKVAVLWTTVGEGTTSHYQVQRSIDGVNFVSIGAVDAKNVTGYANYEFIDSRLPVGVKQLFYRLIIVNNDGFEKRGSVVTVLIPSIEDFDLKLKPNPVSRGGEFSLGYHALQAGQASIVITDMMGNRLRKQLVTLQEGNGEITMKTGNLQAGLYIVQMMQGSKIGTKKLVIQ